MKRLMVQQSKILKTHPLHLFNIIQDVNAYSKFVPHCHASKILRHAPNDDRYFDATLSVGLGSTALSSSTLTETYVSRVFCDKEHLTIHSKSIHSSTKWLESLSSTWKLQPTNGAAQDEAHYLKYFDCHVDFSVELQVSNPLIVMVLEQTLDQVAAQQVDAFEQQCKERPFDIMREHKVDLENMMKLLKKEPAPQ